MYTFINISTCCLQQNIFNFSTAKKKVKKNVPFSLVDRPFTPPPLSGPTKKRFFFAASLREYPPRLYGTRQNAGLKKEVVRFEMKNNINIFFKVM